MRNELAFQTKIVSCFEARGGHAFKCNNRFKAGILDIHYTIDMRENARRLNEVRTGFIECKFQKRTTLKDIHVEATEKQKQFTRKERAAGGVVHGFCFIQHRQKRHLWQLLSFDPAADDNTYTAELTWRDTKVDIWNEIEAYL